MKLYYQKVQKFKNITISFMGTLGKQLTEAWSIAKVLGVEIRWRATVWCAIKNEPIKNEDDEKAVFIQSGIDVNEFDSAKNIFMVKTLTIRQEKAAEQFGITGTPAFYVNGKHHIKNNGMNDSSVEGYGKEFADLVYQLIIKNPQT